MLFQNAFWEHQLPSVLGTEATDSRTLWNFFLLLCPYFHPIFIFHTSKGNFFFSSIDGWRHCIYIHSQGHREGLSTLSHSLFVTLSGSKKQIREISAPTCKEFRSQCSHLHNKKRVEQTDRSRGQKISNYIVELNSTINCVDLTDIFRVFHPIRVEHTFYSSSCETLTKCLCPPKFAC